MPIHIPGKRDRRGRAAPNKRSVVAVLSLTAMVDLFTVLVVFLLQNYNETGEVIEIPKGVSLPEAKQTKMLPPANVIVISTEDILFNGRPVAQYDEVRDQQDWEVVGVLDNVRRAIEEGQEHKESIRGKIQQAVKKAKTQEALLAEGQEAPPEVDEFRKITIQADRDVDFLTMKKIMYSVTEAGIIEINFAVIQQPEKASATL